MPLYILKEFFAFTPACDSHIVTRITGARHQTEREKGKKRGVQTTDART
jgi:hypothetical protein